MDMEGPVMEEATLLYFGTDCVSGKGEYGGSSLTVWDVEANSILLDKVFVYASCKKRGGNNN